MFSGASNNSNATAGGLDFPVIAMTASIGLSIVLAMIGLAGAAGAFNGATWVISGSTFCWIVVGTSVAIGALSLGALAPAALVTLVLGILGLTGTLPLTAVGIGVALTMALALTCGCCVTAHLAH